MIADILLPAAAAGLTALGLTAAAMRRHSLAGVVGGQLAAIGAAVGVLAVVGPAAEAFSVLIVVLAGLAGFLFLTLQRLEDNARADDGGPAAEAEDPLRW